VRELCYKARELLIEEGNVVSVDAPVTVRSCDGSHAYYKPHDDQFTDAALGTDMW